MAGWSDGTAFGTREVYRIDDGAGSIVAQLSVSGASFLVADETPEQQNFSRESLGGCSLPMLLLVEGPDTGCARAITARAGQVAPGGEEHG